MPIDSEREGAAEPHVTEQGAPNLIFHVEVREKREVGARNGPPQFHVEIVPLLTFLEKSVVAEVEAARLQVYFTRAGFGRDQFAVGDHHGDFVDIGELTPLGVDPVEIGIAHADETGRPAGAWC